MPAYWVPLAITSTSFPIILLISGMFSPFGSPLLPFFADRAGLVAITKTRLPLSPPHGLHAPPAGRKLRFAEFAHPLYHMDMHLSSGDCGCRVEPNVGKMGDGKNPRGGAGTSAPPRDQGCNQQSMTVFILFFVPGKHGLDVGQRRMAEGRQINVDEQERGKKEEQEHVDRCHDF